MFQNLPKTTAHNGSNHIRWKHCSLSITSKKRFPAITHYDITLNPAIKTSKNLQQQQMKQKQQQTVFVCYDVSPHRVGQGAPEKEKYMVFWRDFGRAQSHRCWTPTCLQLRICWTWEKPFCKFPNLKIWKTHRSIEAVHVYAQACVGDKDDVDDGGVVGNAQD